MHKFLLILVLKQKNYSCLSKVKKIGAVFLRFMMMHEQIEVLEKSYVLRGSFREIHNWIGDSFFLANESKISLPAWWCTSPHLQTGPWLVENTLQQQSHQSKDRLRMGPTQSWSQPPRFFLVGLPEGSGLQNKPSNHWWAEKKHPNRDGSHWRSNLPRCDVQLHPPHGDVSASGRRTFGATAVGRATLQLEFWYFM